MLLPMHLPVMLCGLICGWRYGMLAGATLPVMRSLVFGMPAFYPNALSMAFELATYGLIIGLVYHVVLKKRNIGCVYIAYLAALPCGRIVWGIVQAFLLDLGGSRLTVTAFITSAVVTAIPGILLQLLLIPTIMLVLRKTVPDL